MISLPTLYIVRVTARRVFCVQYTGDSMTWDLGPGTVVVFIIL